MKREAVDSSLMRSVGYDVQTSTLEIETQKGDVYRYGNVPEFIYRGLMLSKSKGSYFTSKIMDRYPTESVSPVSEIRWRTE